MPAVLQMWTAKDDEHRKRILPEEKYNSTNFQTLWDFEGVLRYSPLFYGWYTNAETVTRGYWMPLAYFITGLVAYAYSFFATLRKMAENSRMSKLSEKDDECIFSWKLFTAWDYMIGNAETAHNRIASIVVGFKEALLEEAEKKRESRNWKVTACRILVNTAVLGLLLFSAFAVVMVVQRSQEPEAKKSVWRSNEITFVMTIISLTFPMIFECLGFFEQYHPRKQLRLQLARIMVLNLLNLYSLIFALFYKINGMTKELEAMKPNNESTSSSLDATPTVNTSLQAYSAMLKCYKNSTSPETDLTPASLIAAIASPIIRKTLSVTTESALTPDFPESGFPNGSDFSQNSSLTPLPTSSTDWSEFDLIKEAFIDYLTYVLFGYNQTRPDFNFTNVSDDSTLSYEYFKTTMTPLLNITSSEMDSRYGSQLTTAFDAISTTLQETRSLCEFCKQHCPPPSSVLPSPSSALPSTTETSPPLDLSYAARRQLRSLCWETMFGQELIKLTVMDLVMTVVSSLALDLARGLFVRVMNRCWCWDLEKKFPQYGDFKVAENILHLVNNQGMVWMGMFFSPGVVAVNVLKLLVLMYFRAWIVLACNVPHEIIFRASRSNNFYYALLLMMLFLCVLPVGYAIVWVRPSWHCGPFSKHERIFYVLTETIKAHVPPLVQKALDYVASPGIVIPLLLLLVLIIYYLVSLTSALREANNDLKIQLRRERTEERRKMFQIADRRRRRSSGGSDSNTPFGKWKKLLGNMPSNGKSFDDTTPRQDSNEFPQIKEEKADKNKDFFAKIFKKALGKSSTSEEDNPEVQNQDEGTDTEQHESLPEDLISIKDSRVQPFKSFDYPKSVLQKRNSQKSNSDSSDRHIHIKDSKPVNPSKEMSVDSSSSVRSDNIPVITISKTESAECILEDSARPVEKFKPKIKCALKKQSTEVDEDLICYFNKELKPGLATFDESLERENGVGVMINSESSDDTARENSADTVLNSPNVIEETEERKEDAGGRNSNGSATESSGAYDDIISL